MIDPSKSNPHRVATSGRARVALAHDWLCGVRGGELVLERLCGLVERKCEPAGLFTMFRDGREIGPIVDRWAGDGLVHVSPLNRLPGASTRLRRWLLPLYPTAIRCLSRGVAREHKRRPIDLVISTSSAAVKGLRAPAGVPHLCYCFSPARYVWGAEHLYAGDFSFKGRLRRTGLQLLGGSFRRWDRRTASNVTRFIAISRHIQTRIRDAFGVESDLIYPPVRTDFFTPDKRTTREDFWLCVGALEPYKRADLAIDAAIRANRQIKVAGSGSQAESLRHRYASSPNVEFHGRVSDASLRDLYRRAAALIFPQEEDFGIVAVEAQACGLPVVALGRGGALDMVINGETGVFFNEETPDAVVDAFERMPRDAGDRCRENALRFSEDRFDREIDSLIRAWLPDRPVSSSR